MLEIEDPMFIDPGEDQKWKGLKRDREKQKYNPDYYTIPDIPLCLMVASLLIHQ